MPTRSTASDLVRTLGDLTGQRVAYPRGDLASPATTNALVAAGADVVDVVAYANVPPRQYATRLKAALPVAATTLMSGSAAQRLSTALEPTERERLGPIVCIGPTTARVAREVGLEVAAVARPHSVAGLVAAPPDRALTFSAHQQPLAPAPSPSREHVQRVGAELQDSPASSGLADRPHRARSHQRPIMDGMTRRRGATAPAHRGQERTLSGLRSCRRRLVMNAVQQDADPRRASPTAALHRERPLPTAGIIASTGECFVDVRQVRPRRTSTPPWRAGSRRTPQTAAWRCGCRRCRGSRGPADRDAGHAAAARAVPSPCPTVAAGSHRAGASRPNECITGVHTLGHRRR